MKTYLLFIISFISVYGIGQSVVKQGFSAFNNANFNNSIILTSGQTVSGQTQNLTSVNGYLPLQTSTVSITEQSTTKLSVYPNPSENIIYLNITKPSTINIYDFTGKLVFSTALTNNLNSINIKHLSKGIYLVKVFQNENYVSSTKLIKQ